MADVALLRTALGDLAAVLDPVTDEESREPSGCRGWSVLDLAYHLVEDAHRTLVDLNSPADGPADTDDVEYWRPGRPSPHDGEDAAIAAGIRERIGDLARRHREACAAVLVAVGRVRLDDVVRGQGVAMTVADELSHYVVEAAIHHLDLVVHLDRPGPAASRSARPTGSRSARSPTASRCSADGGDTGDVPEPTSTDVLVVGAGPAGSAAAAWAARAGHDVVLADAAVFPRDKPCGDGLTPRAIAELELLGLGEWVGKRGRNRGLRAAGFGQELLLPWPGGSLPDHGGAVPRTVLDARIREVALGDGAVPVEGARAVAVERDGDRVTGVVLRRDGGRTTRIACRRLVVADGARSPLGRVLGREWHRDTAYGVAARGYVRSGRSDDEWISSHLELRGVDGELLSGYGWVFPLGDGEVNIGVGTLATAKRPAGVQLKSLLEAYATSRREEWQLEGGVRAPASALLPMGGAVSGVAGRNWALVGDAAGCVNPLNGEGIDYGLETGRDLAALLGEDDWTTAWPATLRRNYGTAFSIARRLAGLITVPRLLPAAGPVGMRSRVLMTLALRVMGNLVTEEDADVVARLWRSAGRWSTRHDARPPWT